MMAVGRVGADLFRLPVAVAEDLAGDLAGGGGRDFDELLFGGRESVGAREIVAGDGLQVAVGEIAAGVEVFGVRGDGFEGGDLHQALAALRRGCWLRNATALRAPVGSSSCLK